MCSAYGALLAAGEEFLSLCTEVVNAQSLAGGSVEPHGESRNVEMGVKRKFAMFSQCFVIFCANICSGAIPWAPGMEAVSKGTVSHLNTLNCCPNI